MLITEMRRQVQTHKRYTQRLNVKHCALNVIQNAQMHVQHL